MWASRARARRRRRGAVLEHWARWSPLLAHRCLQDWRRTTRCARQVAVRMAGKDLQRACACWSAWSAQAKVTGGGRRRAAALGAGAACRRAAAVVAAWFTHARRRAGARRLAEALGRAEARWAPEADWRRRALADPALRAMFGRFALAFDQRRQEMGAASDRRPLATLGAYEALVALIWARQQLSVSLGRLKGYPQPWYLGFWLAGPYPLLAPDNAYYVQAELRLVEMVSRLEAAQSPDQAVSLFWSLCAASPGAAAGLASEEPAWPSRTESTVEQRLLMWQALADLMVVHHPGWIAPQPVPVGMGLPPRQPVPGPAGPGWPQAAPCWPQVAAPGLGLAPPSLLLPHCAPQPGLGWPPMGHLQAPAMGAPPRCGAPAPHGLQAPPAAPFGSLGPPPRAPPPAEPLAGLLGAGPGFPGPMWAPGASRGPPLGGAAARAWPPMEPQATAAPRWPGPKEPIAGGLLPFCTSPSFGDADQAAGGPQLVPEGMALKA